MVWMWYRKCWGALFPQSRETLPCWGACPEGTQLLALCRRPWHPRGWSPVKGRQFLTLCPAVCPCIHRFHDCFLHWAALRPSGGRWDKPIGFSSGTNANFEYHGLGEAWNDVCLGFPFSAVAVAPTMAVCGAEVIQLGVSHVLQSLPIFSTVDETVLAVVVIPPFERIKKKAIVWCKGLGISHSLWQCCWNAGAVAVAILLWAYIP